jgi:glycerol kinase
MPNAILALDQGTTSSRAIVFDSRGLPVATVQREFRQIYPSPGWVEHDAEEIWSTQIGVASDAMMKARGMTIAAIGITNQRETTVLWDRGTGKPIANAIVWQDRRTASFCDELRSAGFESLFRSRTGLLLDPYFSGTKIRWLLENVPGARAKAEAGELAFGTIDSWLIWKLTGGRRHCTDATNASRTLVFDIRKGTWDDELLRLLGIPRSILPEVVSSSGVIGESAEGLPIAAGIPIAGVAGDQQAALFGQRCTRAGMAKNTYGTGSFVVMNSGQEIVTSSRGLLSTIAWWLDQTLGREGVGSANESVRRALRVPTGDERQYAIEGSIFVTGAAVQWLRDSLGLIRTAPEIEALAASVADSNGMMFVPAFTGLGTPYWDPHARGTMVGLTRGTSAAHLARATLDAIALQTVDVLEAMHEDSGIELSELRADGAASTNNLLMQIQADLAGIPVVRTSIPETTALGAAYLAGLGVGFWRSAEEIDAQWKADRRFEPTMSVRAREEMLERWHEAVERAKGWAV